MTAATLLLVAGSVVIVILIIVYRSPILPFVVIFMKEPLKLDFLWAGLCLMGAVYFMFRG